MALTKVTTGGITDATIATADIADSAVATAKIADDAITTVKVLDSNVTEAKLANSAVATAKVADNAITTPKIADENITLAKLEHGTSSNDGKFLRANNGADPTFESLPTSGISDVVSDTSPQLGGDLDIQSNDITGSGNLDLTDSGKIKLGTGDDLQIYHNGSGSFIDVYTNDFQIRNETSEVMAAFNRNGDVELYNDGLKQLETFHASTVGHSPSGGSDITGGGVKTTRTSSTNSNIGYYCYKDSSLVARLSNHGSGPEGILQLYNQGVPKLTMNGTNGTIKLHGNAGYIQFGDTDSASHRFDDYEEGTWTPDWRGSNALGTTSYGTHNSASYVKIGNQVTIRGFSQITGSSGGSGFWFINNMPFTVGGGNDTRYRSVGSVFLEDFNFSSEDVDIICFAERNNNDMQLRTNRDSLGGGTSISVNNDTNFSVMWTITYPTA